MSRHKPQLVIALTLSITATADAERILQTVYPTVLEDFSVSGTAENGTSLSAAVTFQATLGLPRVNPNEFILHSVRGSMSFAGAAASSGTNMRHLVGVHYEFGGQAGISGRSLDYFDGVAGFRDIDSLVDAFGPTIGLARGELYYKVPVTSGQFSDDPTELDPAAFSTNSGPAGQVFPNHVDFNARFGAVAIGQYYNEASPLGAIAIIRLPLFEFVYELTPVADVNRLDWHESDPSSGLYGVGEIDTIAGLDVTNAVPASLMLPGDYNEDFVVDVSDYDQWRSSYGDTSAANTSDGNGDGIVNAADYSIWRDSLGSGFTNLPTFGASRRVQEQKTVPEPYSAALVLLILIAGGTNNRERLT